MLHEFTSATPIAFLGLPGGTEWIVILIIALLLFGRRLPEVMRSLGSGVVEFKKGIKGIEDDVEVESNRSTIAQKEPAKKDEPQSSQS